MGPPAFFHLSPDNQRAMFPRFAAHAKAGAPLMFTSGPEHGEAIGERMGEPLCHGSLDPEEYEALLAHSGHTLLDRVLRDPGCGEATVWLARLASEEACA